MTTQEQSNGVFITPQEELEESVYDNLIYKQKAKQIAEEISELIR